MQAYNHYMLLNAAKMGNAARVVACLHFGVNVDATDSDGDTALIIAVRRNFKHIVFHLVRFAPNVNIPDVHGNTALILAASGGHNELVETLLSEPGINVNAINSNGETALHVAFKHNNYGIAARLLKVPNVKVRSYLENYSPAAVMLILAAQQRHQWQTRRPWILLCMK